jgi:hypothetical protein
MDFLWMHISLNQSNQSSTSHTSSLPSASHEKCLMAKGKKKKKPMKVESEEEEEEEYDFDFDKLSKKDMIKIKNLFEKNLRIRVVT